VSVRKDSGEGGPVANDPDENPTDGSRQLRFRFRFVILVGLSVLVTVGWVSSSSVVPRPWVDYAREIGIDGEREWTFCVAFDRPGITGRQAGGTFRGATSISLHMIAEDLGFRRDEIGFYQIRSEDRERAQAPHAFGATPARCGSHSRSGRAGRGDHS
jgi:hypothetical protein